MRLQSPAFSLRKSAQGALVFSPSGRLLAQVTSKVIVWDVEQRAVVAQIKALANEHHLAFAQDDSVLAIKSSNGELAFCEPRSGRVLSSTGGFKAHRSGCGPRFSFDGCHLLDGDSNGMLIVWDVASAANEGAWHVGDCMIGDIASCVETSTYAVAANAKAGLRSGGSLLLLDAAMDFAKARNIEPPLALRERGGWRGIAQLAFSPDGRELAIVAERGGETPPSLGVVAVADGALRWRVAMPDLGCDIRSLSWSAGGDIAIVVHEAMPRGMKFNEWSRYRQEHDLEYVEIRSALDGTLRVRRVFDGACNAQFRPDSEALAVTSANVPGVYVSDVDKLPAISRVAACG